VRVAGSAHTGTVTLPGNLAGEFACNGRTAPHQPGMNQIDPQ
jgi:hypothetical protein